MARDSGLMKWALLAGGGYLAYRWWQQQQAAEPAANGAPGGVMTQWDALVKSLQQTIAGGPQPGDTSSVQKPQEPVDVNGAPGNGAPPPGMTPVAADLTSQLLKTAGVGVSHRFNTHQWNYYMRGVLGLAQSADMPDLAAAGDPTDLLSADQYLERRATLGLSGLGYARPMSPARTPLWVHRDTGAGLSCGMGGCETRPQWVM